MIYRFLADFVLIIHLCFVLFAVFGGLLVLRWRWIALLHLPALIWGFLVQYFVWICPLTPLENYFRNLGGETGYAGGFVEYYASAILYPSMTVNLHLILGFSLLIFNLFVYGWLISRLRRFP